MEQAFILIVDESVHQLSLRHFNSLFFSIVVEPAPPGEESVLPSEAAIVKMLGEFTEAPLVGIEYLVEILIPNLDPIYKCELCNTTLSADTVVSCLISAAHRLKYLVRAAKTIFSYEQGYQRLCRSLL